LHPLQVAQPLLGGIAGDVETLAVLFHEGAGHRFDRTGIVVLHELAVPDLYVTAEFRCVGEGTLLVADLAM